MADAQSPQPQDSPPSTIPLKRPHEDEHAPSISSPLNPNAAARVPQREQRTKKESLKKRESAAPSPTTGKAPSKSGKKTKAEAEDTEVPTPSPIRYNHAPTQSWQYVNKPLPWLSREPEPVYAPNGAEMKKPLDLPENKKNFRYNHCVADPMFKYSRFYRQSEEAPYGPRLNFQDSDRNFHFDPIGGRIITNEKGWRMGRANIVAREGTFYYEVKILKGVPPDGSTGTLPSQANGPLPHVRMGFSRREAPLDAPVGFDGYSYGLTDIRMEPMHKSRASKFLDAGDDPKPGKKPRPKKGQQSKSAYGKDAGFAADDTARTGDVIGLSITLPSIAVQRKVLDGTFNPAVDLAPTASIAEQAEPAPNIVRDRYPVPYRNAMYFESLEYRATKGMEGYGDRGPFGKEEPSTAHTDPSLRTLPESSIKVWKNGKRIGTAFRNLMAFLPPASQPANERGVRQGMDDGMVGYLPAVSAFSGAVAEVNFGPDFWCSPEELEDTGGKQKGKEESQENPQEDTEMTDAPAAGTEQKDEKEEERLVGVGMRGIGVRFAEQIAEDVVYDVIDEVDFFVQDGAKLDDEEPGVKVEE
ncbi:MAG: hypothetical protein Q9159_004858 [Coniocarpon cinnabarinum]